MISLRNIQVNCRQASVPSSFYEKKATYHVIFAFVFVLVSINLSGCKNGPDKSKLEEERKALILSKRMPRYMGKCRNLTQDERKKRENEGRIPSFRFKVHPQVIEFEYLIRGAMRFEGEAIGDFIIVRSNGMPAYNFAVVIGDHLI